MTPAMQQNGVRGRDSAGGPGAGPRIADGDVCLASATPAPPTVLRGAKCHATAGRADIGIDGVRVVFPLGCLDAVRSTLCQVFGPPCPRRSGTKGYHYGESFDCGAVLSWGPVTDTPHAGVCVEFKGRAASVLGQDGLARLAANLHDLGAVCRRIDVRADFRAADGLNPGVIDAVQAACDRGELRGARKWRPAAFFDGVTLEGKGVYVGVRGRNGSGRYLRVYDKGLETGEAPVGEWERWEVEFSADPAGLVWDAWIAGIERAFEDREGDWGQVPSAVAADLAERAFGTVDFRVPGDRLSRSERCGWWATFLAAMEPVASRCKRFVTTLEGFTAHAKRTIVPQLKAFSQSIGSTLGEAFELLVGRSDDVEAASPKRATVVAFRESYGRDWRVEARERRAVGRHMGERFESWICDVRQRSLELTRAAALVHPAFKPEVLPWE